MIKKREYQRHSEPKLFQCTFDNCDMIFTRSEHLARHIRKHTGEKPFKCIIPGCERMFSRFDNMIQHTATHTNKENKRVYNKKQHNITKDVKIVNKKMKHTPKSLAPLVSSSFNQINSYSNLTSPPPLIKEEEEEKINHSKLSSNYNHHITLPITPSEPDFNLPPTPHHHYQQSLPHINELCYYQETPYSHHSYPYHTMINHSPTQSHFLPSPTEFYFNENHLSSSSSSYIQSSQQHYPYHHQNEENNSISGSDSCSIYSEPSISSINHYHHQHQSTTTSTNTSTNVNTLSSPSSIQITSDEFEALQGIFQLKSNQSNTSSIKSSPLPLSPSSSSTSSSLSPSSLSLFYHMDYDNNNYHVNSFRQHFELAQESSSRLSPRSM